MLSEFDWRAVIGERERQLADILPIADHDDIPADVLEAVADILGRALDDLAAAGFTPGMNWTEAALTKGIS